MVRVRVTDPIVLGPRTDWQAWEPVARAGTGRIVVLDLGGVSRVDAAGLGLLVRLATAVRGRGGYLRLDRVQPRVQRLVEATGLAEAVGLDAISCLPSR